MASHILNSIDQLNSNLLTYIMLSGHVVAFGTQ